MAPRRARRHLAWRRRQQIQQAVSIDHRRQLRVLCGPVNVEVALGSTRIFVFSLVWYGQNRILGVWQLILANVFAERVGCIEPGKDVVHRRSSNAGQSDRL
jgi:hypothetical protein